MGVEKPREYWNELSNKETWKEYILPKRTDEQFDNEGLLEAHRLFYFLGRNKNIIDYGCGIGRVTQYVSLYSRNIIGLDVCKKYIEIAKKQNVQKNVKFYEIASYAKNNTADFLYCLMVLQHNDDLNREKIMLHIHSLLKNGGEAIIQFPRIESTYYTESPFVHLFSKEEIVNYGKMFDTHKISLGNLVDYGAQYDSSLDHEYFLYVKK